MVHFKANKQTTVSKTPFYLIGLRFVIEKTMEQNKKTSNMGKGIRGKKNTDFFHDQSYRE